MRVAMGVLAALTLLPAISQAQLCPGPCPSSVGLPTPTVYGASTVGTGPTLSPGGAGSVVKPSDGRVCNGDGVCVSVSKGTASITMPAKEGDVTSVKGNKSGQGLYVGGLDANDIVEPKSGSLVTLAGAGGGTVVGSKSNGSTVINNCTGPITWEGPGGAKFGVIPPGGVLKLEG